MVRAAQGEEQDPFRQTVPDLDAKQVHTGQTAHKSETLHVQTLDGG